MAAFWVNYYYAVVGYFFAQMMEERLDLKDYYSIFGEVVYRYIMYCGYKCLTSLQKFGGAAVLTLKLGPRKS